MKKLIYVIVLLASFQLVQAQNIISTTTVPIELRASIQKDSEPLSVFGGISILEQRCTALDLYTGYAVEGEDTIDFYITSTDIFFQIGMFFPLSALKIQGGVDSVVAYLAPLDGETGTCDATIYQYNPATQKYEVLAVSNPVNLSDIPLNKGTKFRFNSKFNVTQDVLVVVGMKDNPDGTGIGLYTTKNNCYKYEKWLIGITYSDGKIVTVNSKFPELKVEGAIFIHGNLTFETTSVNENTMKSVKIYPNPIRDNLKIENLNEATDINIYTVTGQLVRTILSAEGSTEIDMSNLSNGMYFIKMQNGKSIRTEKIQIVR